MPILVRIAVGLLVTALMINNSFDLLFQFVNASHAAAFIQMIQQADPAWIDPAGCRALILAIIVLAYLGAGLLATEIIYYSALAVCGMVAGSIAGACIALRWLFRRVWQNLLFHYRGW
ncbi:hypothetical protein A9R05_42550 (plasmid) [Burkholderia sp. KK1]|uniref:hypothetical protein n=1 Tax=Burkholderia sp. M701 TaxID=326454 RepID=UPI000979B046|nr:hypothetical protein [Burkholderia sp. M701]AQH05702.1 hypothetical protein A9R05_42550 [Burkholderia sp. KK1]